MTDVAVVGIGDWGKNLVRVFDAEATVRTCCHTGDPDNARWLADNYPDVTVTTDYADVLDSDVDAVVVATPIETHVPLVREALRADKHVFVEKPLGPDRDEAATLADLARERDRRLFVGYLFVHHPLFGSLADVVADHGLRWMDLAWNYVGGFDAPLLQQYVCHPVSVTTALCGDAGRDGVPRPTVDGPDAPNHPAVSVTTAEGVTDGPDVLSCVLDYGAVTCVLRINRLSPREQNTRITLATESGDCYVWDDTTLRQFDEADGAFSTVATAEVEPLTAECRAFLSCVDDGSTPVTDGEFAVVVHDVLDEIERQWDTV